MILSGGMSRSDSDVPPGLNISVYDNDLICLYMYSFCSLRWKKKKVLHKEKYSD